MLDWEEFLDVMKMLASFTLVVAAYGVCLAALLAVAYTIGNILALVG